MPYGRKSTGIFQSRLLAGRPTSDNMQLGVLFRNRAIVSIFASFCVNNGRDITGLRYSIMKRVPFITAGHPLSRDITGTGTHASA